MFDEGLGALPSYSRRRPGAASHCRYERQRPLLTPAWKPSSDEALAARPIDEQLTVPMRSR